MNRQEERGRPSARSMPSDPRPRPGSRNCRGKTRSGIPCRLPATSGQGFCIHHDPALSSQERRRELSERGRRGALARAKAIREEREAIRSKIAMATVHQIRTVLEESVSRVRASTGDVVSRESVVIRACMACLEVLKAADAARAVEALKAEVAQLEGQLGPAA